MIVVLVGPGEVGGGGGVSYQDDYALSFEASRASLMLSHAMVLSLAHKYRTIACSWLWSLWCETGLSMSWGAPSPSRQNSSVRVSTLMKDRQTLVC